VNGKPALLRSPGRPSRDWLTLAGLVIASSVFVGWTMGRYLGQQRLMLLAPDLAIHFQALLNTLDGHFLRYTIEGQWSPAGQLCYLGSHVSVIQLIYLPVILVWRHPAALAAGQAVLLAAGSAFIAGLARVKFPEHRAAPIAFAVVYLFTPLLMTQAHEFHPETLAVPAAAMLFYHHARRQPRGIAVAGVLMVMCREDACVFVALFAALFLIPDRQFRVFGSVTAALSAGLFLIELTAVLPHFAGGRVHLWRYSYLSDALTDPLAAVATSNLRLFPWYFVFILLPYLLLPVVSPRLLLFAAAVLAPVVLSSNPGDATFARHYGLPAALPMLVGVMCALCRLGERWRRGLLLALPLWTVLLNSVDYNSLYLYRYLVPNSGVPWRSAGPPPRFAREAEQALQWPGTVSAAATMIALARAHTEVYPFPINWRIADVIITDNRSSYYPLGRQQAEAALRELEADPQFSVQAAGESLRIYRRATASIPNSANVPDN